MGTFGRRVAKFAVWVVCFAFLSMGASASPIIPKTATSTDISDIWWNALESGWGMQLVQADNFVFATVFIYGPDGKPTWITAQLTQQPGLVFTGPLYVTTGPYFGGTFNPANVTVRQAGTLTFTLQTVSTGLVQYSVDGVAVSKQVERQTLKADNYNGTYVVAVNFTQSGCFNPAINGSVTGALSMSVSQTPTAMSMVWGFSNSDVCTYSGAYTQTGKMGRFTGAFSCTTGETGNMVFFEMTNRVGMMNGRINGTSATLGCSYSGRFTGLNPDVP